MERYRYAKWLGRSVAALGFVSAVLGPACSDDAAPQTSNDAGQSEDAGNADVTAAGGSAGQGPGPGTGGIGHPQPDHAVPDYDAGRECGALVVGERQTMPPAGGVCAVEAGTMRLTYACLPRPPAGTTCQEAYDESCVLYTYLCGLNKRGTTILCGPVSDDGDNCCYVTTGACLIG